MSTNSLYSVVSESYSVPASPISTSSLRSVVLDPDEFPSNYGSTGNRMNDTVSVVAYERIDNGTNADQTSPLSERDVDPVSQPWLSETTKGWLKMAAIFFLFLLVLAAIPLSILLLPTTHAVLEA